MPVKLTAMYTTEPSTLRIVTPIRKSVLAPKLRKRVSDVKRQPVVIDYDVRLTRRA